MTLYNTLFSLTSFCYLPSGILSFGAIVNWLADWFLATFAGCQSCLLLSMVNLSSVPYHSLVEIFKSLHFSARPPGTAPNSGKFHPTLRAI